MEQFFVKVSGEYDFYLIANGLNHLGAKCSKQEDGKYKFEYTYTVYKSGGADTSKTTKTVTTLLTPNKTVDLHISKPAHEYIRGVYNKSITISVTLLTADKALKGIKKEPSYVYGYLLLNAGNEDEFIKCLNSFEEPKDDTWIIHDNDKYDMLSLAYTYGVGRPKDERKALLNALRSIRLSSYAPFIEKGYAKKTIMNLDWFIARTNDRHTNADNYLLGNALIEEGFAKAGESRIIWGADCISYNYPEFYEQGNEVALHYQELLHKQASEILDSRGKDEEAFFHYATYLAYKKFGNDKFIHYEKMVSNDDPYDPSYSYVNYDDIDKMKALVREAAMSGDEFAQKLVRD